MPGHRGVDRGSDKTDEGQDPVAAQEWRKVFNITLIAADDFMADTADAAVLRATWASWHSAAASSRIRTCRSGPASVSPSHSTTRVLPTRSMRGHTDFATYQEARSRAVVYLHGPGGRGGVLG